MLPLHVFILDRNMGCIKLSILEKEYKESELKVSSYQKNLTSNFFAEKACSSLFNAKEMDSESGLYYFEQRYYDPKGTFISRDPLFEKYPWISCYAYCANNPLRWIDPTGMSPEDPGDGCGNPPNKEPIGYESGKGTEKNPITLSEVRVSAERINPSQGGTLRQTDNLTSFEMWLDSPSESMGEAIGKIAANVGYSIINAPYSLLTGRTLGGSSLNSTEKMDAFVDFIPSLLSGGLTKTGQVIKTSEKGLKGYNQFLKKSGTEFKGSNWQQRAGEAFQQNKVQQQGLEAFDKVRDVQRVVTPTKKELGK